MLVRPVALGDQQRITDLLAAMDYPDTSGFISQRLQQQIEHPDALTLVAEQAQQVIGLISVHYMAQLAVAGEVFFINYLSVDPAQRGRGVGRLLLQQAEQAAQARGCYSIELSSNLRRTRAHQFYLQLGYTETSRYFVKVF